MYGEKRELIAINCKRCGKGVAMRVDREDIERRSHMLVQDAFSDRSGVPYLTPDERELFVSGWCGACWRTGQVNNTAEMN